MAQLDALTADIGIAITKLGTVNQLITDLATANAQIAVLTQQATDDQAKIDALDAQLKAAL